MLPDQLASNGFTAEQWDELETMARRVVDEHAQLRHLIPRGADALGAHTVVVPTYVAGPPATLALTTHLVPTMLSTRFKITSDQIGDLDVASRLVERAARLLATGEDIQLHRGEAANGVDVTPTRDTLLNSATLEVKNAAIEELLRLGVDSLAGYVYNPPLTLAWSAAIWLKEYSALKDGARETVRRTLGEGGRFLRIPGTHSSTKAVLFAMDPCALDLVFVEHPTIALVQISGGDLELRLQERFLMRMMDKAAVVKLDLS